MSRGQLPLALFATGSADFDEYYAGPNGEALQALRSWAAGAGPWCIGLWSGARVGKSHLLQAAVRAAGERGRRAMYLPLREARPYGAGALEDLEAVELICIDDLDEVAGDPDWERALFRLHEATAAASGRLAFAGREAPRALAFALPDLRSRLCAALVYHLRDLSEPDKRQALAAAAARRGLALPEPVATFILRRQSRELPDLLETLATLDHASLAHGRPLTVPFVREILGFAEQQ